MIKPQPWVKEYNEARRLGDLTPREYLLTNKPEFLFISDHNWETYNCDWDLCVLLPDLLFLVARAC